ncbi:TPA: BspA family leucine-rich repeat surface protein [Enterococcus faecalis]
MKKIVCTVLLCVSFFSDVVLAQETTSEKKDDVTIVENSNPEKQVVSSEDTMAYGWDYSKISDTNAMYIGRSGDQKTGYYGDEKNIKIPSRIGDYNVAFDFSKGLSYHGIDKEKVETISFVDNGSSKTDSNVKGVSYQLPEGMYTVHNKANEATQIIVNKFKMDFSDYPNLKSIDFSGIDFSIGNYSDFQQMFKNCPSLQSIKLTSKTSSNWNCNINMDGMFEGDKSLSEIDLLPLTSFPLVNIELGNNTFKDCTLLNKVKLNNLINGQSNIILDGNKTTFLNTPNLVKLDINDAQFEKSMLEENFFSNKDWAGVIENGQVILKQYLGTARDIVVPNEVNGMSTKINLENGITLANLSKDTINSITFSSDKNKKVKSLGNKISFASWAGLKSFNGEGLDITGITNLSSIFNQCVRLESVNLKGWDTSKVTDFSNFFSNCSSLGGTLDVSDLLKKSKPRNVQSMFAYTGLDKIILNNVDLSVANVSLMFGWTFSLHTLDLKGSIFNKDIASANLIFFSGPEKEMKIYADSNTPLKNYDFKKDNIIPESINIKLLGNGGFFSNGNSEKDIKQSMTIINPELTIDPLTIEEPRKDGSVFSQWEKSIDGSNEIWTAYYDWKFEYQDDKCLLTDYVGTNLNIVVPNRIGNRNTKIDLSNGITTTNLPKSNIKDSVSAIQTIMFDDSNSSKVELAGSSINFNNYRDLKYFNGEGLNTDNLQTLNSVFKNASQLKELNISNWDTSKVKDMKSAFENCRELTSVDLSSWNVTSVNDMQRMFRGVGKINFLNLKSWKLTENVNLQKMFEVFSNTPLLIIANDKNLLTYDFKSDYRIPSGPSFNANGGIFNDGTTEKQYFDVCAVRPDDSKLELSSLKEFSRQLRPMSSKGLFLFWGRNLANINNVLESLKTTIYAQWQYIPYEDSNIATNATSEFGIAYMPRNFNFSSNKLKDFGIQNILLNGEKNTFHVGVIDKRNKDSQWRLTAQLHWNNKELVGAELRTTTTGNVSKNINNGSKKFTLDDLVSVGSLIKSTKQLVIDSEKTSDVMVTNSGNKNWVFDVDLGSIYLMLKDTHSIKPGEYSGVVKWNLTVAP